MNNRMFIINIIIVADNTHSNCNKYPYMKSYKNRQNVTNIIYVSGTCPQDMDVCDLQTVLKDSTIILTSKKEATTHEAAHRMCIK
jgi:ABC-type sugar transport system ATPase subunit